MFRAIFSAETWILPFAIISRMALDPNWSHQWVSGPLSVGIRQPVCEADCLPPFSAKGYDVWNFT